MGDSVKGAIPVDERGLSPFRAAAEAGDFERAIRALSPDVVFRSPALHRPIEGRDAVAPLLRIVGAVVKEHLQYVWQVREGDREVLSFRTRVDDREVEGVDILRYGPDGLVAELTVMMRPYGGLMAVGAAVAAHAAKS